MEDSMLIEILKEMQKKYHSILEIERITQDIGDSLSRNDRAMVQMLLGMRQEELDQVSICDKNIGCLASALPPLEAAQVFNWIKGKADRKPHNPMAEKLVEKGNSIQLVLKRTIDIDRHISIRLAGKDSYYK